jgi:uncharacterized protein with von Willebrand factor type A (vWA) domain
MAESGWFDADAVIISDFIAQRLPEEVIKKVKQQQQNHQQRFHAVAMSSYGQTRHHAHLRSYLAL